MLDWLTPDTLILGPRPGKKSFDRLDALSLTHCVTLLGEREDPYPIRKICKRLGCEWLWLPIAGGHVDTLAALDLAAHIQALDLAVRNTPAPKIYLHCSAGIHRTGFFAYALLRVQGMDVGTARKCLSELRSVTALQVGEERLELADSLLSALIKN